MNITNIRVKRAITHEVVRAAQLEERPPVLSDEMIALNEKGIELIGKRLTTAISSGSHSVDVTVDDATSGSPFVRISSLLDIEDAAFISQSKYLAKSLSLAQTAGTIKAGTAIFIDGTCLSYGINSRFIAVIKADSDQAFYKDISDEHNIKLTYVSDMLLGESQRLIKIGFFLEEQAPQLERAIDYEVRRPEEFSIKVFDHMLQNSGDGAAAQYFYGIFLKCRQADNSARKTKLFFETAREYIDSLLIPPYEKVDLRCDLISYVRSNRATLEPRTFALDVLPPECQDSFIRKCRESDISDSITKDISLLKGKLRRQSLKFSSNVIMYASPEVFKESVKIVGTTEDGWTEVKIKGLVE